MGTSGEKLKRMRRFIMYAFLTAVSGIFNSYGTQLHVGTKKKYNTIKEAVLHASPFDTIIVHKGIYKEHTIVLNKPLTLIANGKAVIDADGQAADILVLVSDSISVKGFELINVGVSFLKEIAAIKLRRVKHVKINNNLIKNCFFGIYLEQASYCEITSNQILGSFDDEASAGNAIHAWKGKHLRIDGNTLHGHRDGIYFEFIDDSSISYNHSYDNLRYGLHFMFSNRDEYCDNIFEKNGAGVAVMFSKQIIMINNSFMYNWGGASYGLLLKEISDGKIKGNQFIQNTIGILAEGANRLDINENQFSNNGTAMDMKGNCMDNNIESNNFLANTFEVVTNSKYNTNLYKSNYWRGYSGYDLDRDGYGDVPYRPVNLFAKITHQIPSATIMLHSTFVNLMEVGEKIFPQLIPEELIDNTPKMRPYIYD